MGGYNNHSRGYQYIVTKSANVYAVFYCVVRFVKNIQTLNEKWLLQSNTKSSCIQARNHGNIGPSDRIAYRTSLQQYSRLGELFQLTTWSKLLREFKQVVARYVGSRAYLKPNYSIVKL